MYIQQMRFGERLNYQIECMAETDSIIIPTFTFQPLVENAIIHGLAPKEEGGTIHIKVWSEKEDVFITLRVTKDNMKLWLSFC
jgi:sensor histidine kinase YesM